MAPHTPAEHRAVVTVPGRWAVELHGTGLCRQTAAQGFPQAVRTSSFKMLPSVFLLCLWWAVGGFRVCGTGLAGEGWHGAEVTLCTFVFCCGQVALSKLIQNA